MNIQHSKGAFMTPTLTKKCLMIFLLCCMTTRHIHAVDWYTTLAGVVLALCGLTSDDPKKDQKASQQQQKTQTPAPRPAPQPRQFAQQKPDQQQLFNTLEEKLRTLTDINRQSDTIRDALWKKKKKVVRNTIRKNFSTHVQAEQYALEHLPSKIRKLFLDNVNGYAGTKLSSITDKTKVAEYFAHQIDQKFHLKLPVTNLFKNLESDIDSYIQRHIINQKYTAPQRPVVTHDYTPSAPPATEFENHLTPNNVSFVKEILPEGETDIVAFKSKTTRNEIYNSNKCCSCHDPFFTELHKRATLRCGHQICPDCLYNWIVTRNKAHLIPDCPTCRHPIATKDFSETYLQQHINH